MHLAKLESIVSEKGDMRQMLVIFPNFFPWDTQLWDWIYLWHDIICKVLFLCLEKRAIYVFLRKNIQRHAWILPQARLMKIWKTFQMETLANLSSSPKQSTANSKYFCWQTLFCSIKFFPIRNLLPQRPGKKGLESSMNIVKWRLHFALGPEGSIRSSHPTPALKKKKNKAHTTIEQNKKIRRISPTHLCIQSAKCA